MDDLKYPQKSHKMPKKDITGKEFGLLTVTRYDKDGKWFCKCKGCGTVISVKSNNLRNGNTKGCGRCGNRRAALKKIIDGTNPDNITKSLNKNNTSGFKGVSYNSRKQKWVAQINFRGTHYHLGYHVKFEDAIKARKEVEKRLYSEYLKRLKETNYKKWLEISQKMKSTD